jgi:3-oxoacyl-[acyl-carrier-protein] synthase II
MGIVSATGINVGQFRDNLFAGKSGIQGIQSYDTTGCRTQVGAEVREIDFASYVTRTKLSQLDRLCLLVIVAADEAVADAALNLEVDKSVLGVILGTGLGPSSSIEESISRLSNQQRLRPTTILKIMLNSPAATLCERYQCREMSHVHVTACASSAHAIAQAADYIRRGELDLCLAGGSDAFPSRALFAAWDALGVMTPDNNHPQQAMRPFSADRTGFVIGEGAAVLVLESQERAQGRGARIHAEIAGAGSSSHTPNLTMPSVEGMAFAISRALKNANVAPTEVGYVNAHGTATELNDVLETRALHQVFGEHSAALRVSSTKAAHGHTMGASGAIESVATILALNHRLAPPTLNLLRPDPECDLDYTPNEAREMDCAVAATNSFAFGGHYVTLIIKRGDSSIGA